MSPLPPKPSSLIVPPGPVRAVVNKTASFVAKNGPSFESRILGSAQGSTPKFAFLQPTSPYHGYYQWRIEWFKAGGDLDLEAKQEEEEASRLREED
eukprot:CAMPEP_0197548626 /NCGR_PEP_ID=MMETSP1320-20131121/2704_1 /TAXON_ID=91990 /ORGANISM="Bolidomonas sp., Strain RCC2347" /LENGTH=95 /DNA_ID=CAMNT_0043108675 /DNA_START=69 /DNA_END=353 /DNA_ORIENTATION=-